MILRHTQQYEMYRFLSWHPDYVDERKRREQILASNTQERGDKNTEKNT